MLGVYEEVRLVADRLRDTDLGDLVCGSVKFDESFVFLGCTNLEAWCNELSDEVLEIRDLVYGDKLGFGRPFDWVNAGSLVQLFCCNMEYADELLFMPLESVFSGKGGGVLDGDDEDWWYKGGKGEYVEELVNRFCEVFREDDESESPFKNTFSRCTPLPFFTMFGFGSLALFGLTFEFDNDDEFGSFVWQFPFLLIIILVFVADGLIMGDLGRSWLSTDIETCRDTPMPWIEVPFEGDILLLVFFPMYVKYENYLVNDDL